MRFDTLLVMIMAAAIALISARPHAGSWNDGSRLAAAESLVDHGTLAIDRSVFVQVPAPDDPERRSPYPPDDEGLQRGTLDKLFIDGRFYSDKSPVPNLYLAAVYKALQAATGLRAARQPELFCYLMTVLSAGIAFVAAAVATHRIGRDVGLSRSQALALTAGLATATLALVYVRQVNQHIMLLGVASVLTWLLLRSIRQDGVPWRIAAFAGMLGGAAYAIDLGAGPPLWLFTGLFLVWRSRSMMVAAVYVLGSAPWLVLHHAVNYEIGHSLLPANMIAAHFAYDGSPFDAANLTGTLQHEGVLGFIAYALDMLWGKKGFVLHNLPLLILLAIPMAKGEWRPGERPILIWMVLWMVSTWLLYAATSNNLGGGSVSIRWFLPFLGPLWLALAVVLRDRRVSWSEYRILAAFGVVLSIIGWWVGPWTLRMVPGYWIVVGFAVLAWIIQRRLATSRTRSTEA